MTSWSHTNDASNCCNILSSQDDFGEVARRTKKHGLPAQEHLGHKQDQRRRAPTRASNRQAVNLDSSRYLGYSSSRSILGKPDSHITPEKGIQVCPVGFRCLYSLSSWQPSFQVSCSSKSSISFMPPPRLFRWYISHLHYQKKIHHQSLPKPLPTTSVFGLHISMLLRF
jgi:hypothetical protein